MAAASHRHRGRPVGHSLNDHLGDDADAMRQELLPAGGLVARLFRRHNGTHGVAVRSAPALLDIAASRAGDRLFPHVANMLYDRAVEASFPGTKAGRVIAIPAQNLRSSVWPSLLNFSLSRAQRFPSPKPRWEERTNIPG